MKTSLDITEIAKALCEAQKEIQNAHKDKKNPFYKSSYADLASSWDACRVPLTSNGLSIVQTNASIKNDHYLITRLMHTSGQWIESRMKMILAKNDMQGLGSAKTYARRQELQSIVGISPSDDDANASVKGKAPEGKGYTREDAVKDAEKKETAGKPPAKTEGSGAEHARFKAKKVMMKEAKVHFNGPDEFKMWRIDADLPESLDKISDEQIDAIYKALQNIGDDVAEAKGERA